MQCKVNSDPTIAASQAQPGETFVINHPRLSGVVLAHLRLPMPPGLPAVACVVIASQQPEFVTGAMVVVPAKTRVISVAPRELPEFVALEA